MSEDTRGRSSGAPRRRRRDGVASGSDSVPRARRCGAGGVDSITSMLKVAAGPEWAGQGGADEGADEGAEEGTSVMTSSLTNMSLEIVELARHQCEWCGQV